MALLFVMGICGTIAGAVGAVNQQNDINQQSCQYFDQMQQYQTSIQQIIQEDQMMISQYIQQTNNLNDNISDLMYSLRDTRKKFKDSYNLQVVIYTVFIILIIFILVTKKIIYHAHT